MYTIKLEFTKKGWMRFISHLDLMRLFYRALRRADLPVTISKGFSPRPKISVTPALKLGKESDSLELTVKLDEELERGQVPSVSPAMSRKGPVPISFKERLQAQLPEGIKLL